MPRYAASVQYDGSHYHGWQSLKSGLPTVQAAVEAALSKVANHPVSVVCAGRTDAGVHGSNQIIHFDSDSVRSERGWTYGSNANLPDDVAINWVKPVVDDFHARFSAQWRRYRYVIYNHPIRPAYLPKGVTWNYRPLDIERMQSAACHLVGEHDFTSYRAVQCQAKNPVRTISRLQVSRHGHLVVLDIQANAFLHHMVRNIAGVLMTIGAGKHEPDWAKTVLEARDRTEGGVTAPPYGLYFVDVGYPEVFGLPDSEPNPHFVAPLLPW
ncbi:pseudouridine synthase [Endozoicomonas montiporae]|uniref:tRNA pseudouridine synthase A n=2 Tax=Endozoicomonas montiporae TaxID=1027273 RepID=A0A081NAJ9_9GAMM|nr:tRNA pseudouridine(38-40) synthase TruA [Endozoicomonas montiporae]AMO56853.1 tRNA pseudouridine synthase A [Endozoicomonas montiporae CL-33]KEQ15472.1 pseudouridine synthase [Endozoicomonas montiporae]